MKLPQHPGEESHLTLVERRKLRDGEENTTCETESEGEQQQKQRVLQDDFAHVSEDGEERAEERVESKLVKDLHPNATSQYSKISLREVVGLESEHGDVVVSSSLLFEIEN